MRKDLKKASEYINKANKIICKVIETEGIPDSVKERLEKVNEAFSIDSDELIRISER